MLESLTFMTKLGDVYVEKQAKVPPEASMSITLPAERKRSVSYGASVSVLSRLKFERFILMISDGEAAVPVAKSAEPSDVSITAELTSPSVGPRVKFPVMVRSERRILRIDAGAPRVPQ